MVEREQVIEIGVAVAAVAVMLAAMLTIGSTYGAENSTLSPAGGQMLVGVIVGFIFLMTAVGVGLAYTLNDPEDDLDADDDENGDAQGTV
ncbi:DUF7472 family protein [Natrinema altunense]|uniref:Cox cluster protein n=2 Tax=Natrinema altunense TaxID=222984 RepID=L9ZFW0_NATA2|nr:hypothetical protein [Natrinema altunense]ELY85234.1 hypothetical protein C485_13215 [Natrinema altunense JCM 12890]RZH68783.1 hypothetical protein ELS17_04805 [Natrinema altunense]